MVQLLLEASAYVEEQNENGHTPLMEAASGGHIGKRVLSYMPSLHVCHGSCNLVSPTVLKVVYLNSLL